MSSGDLLKCHTFDFFDEIPMDQGHTLDQLTGRFQSVKDGLPELVKNSKDHYAFLGITEKTERQILVIANSEKEVLAVIDFAGATSRDFEGWWTWSGRSPIRQTRAPDIEAGHGNGGKAFMVRGSTGVAFIESCAIGVRTKMGFQNDDADRRYLPGYALEKGKRIKDVVENNPQARLAAALKELGISFEKLPELARSCFLRRQAYTLVQIEEVKDWQNRQRRTIPKLLHEIQPQLRVHPQAALTIETSSVWVFVDGQSVTPEPLQSHLPDPMEGFESPHQIAVPGELLDPSTNELTPTGSGDGTVKFLELRTSDKSLRLAEMKPLNVIRVYNDRNVVTSWSIADLVPRAESAFIYGKLRIPDLSDEHTVGSDRTDLADSSLVRALRQWVTKCIDGLASQIQMAQAKYHKPEDRDKTNDRLVHFRELMRRFLKADPTVGDVENNGKVGSNSGGDGTVTRQQRQRGNVVRDVILERGNDSISLALGTSIPLAVHCYEIRPDGQRWIVPDAAVELIADQNGVVELKEGRMLRACSTGKVVAFVKAKESGVASNRVLIEVVECTGADLVAPERPLLQGERVRLKVSFQTALGLRDDLLIEGFVDEPDAGAISRNGMFTAGRRETSATVRVRYGTDASNTVTQRVEVGPDSVPPSKGKGGTRGGDIPLILLCGSDAPGMEEYPPERRTHSGGEYYPTIIDFDPVFEHVIWINPDSKEALRVRGKRGGRRGPSGIGSRGFTQFVALKCFDILKRLRVRQAVGDSAVTEVQFRQELAQAETDCAAFIDEAYSLAETLHISDQEETE
jgi:hypothetical protein